MYTRFMGGLYSLIQYCFLYIVAFAQLLRGHLLQNFNKIYAKTNWVHQKLDTSRLYGAFCQPVWLDQYSLCKIPHLHKYTFEWNKQLIIMLIHLLDIKAFVITLWWIKIAKLLPLVQSIICNMPKHFQSEKRMIYSIVTVLYTSMPLYRWHFWWDFQLDPLSLVYL